MTTEKFITHGYIPLLAVAILFALALVAVGYTPSLYKRLSMVYVPHVYTYLTYESNEERLWAALRGSNKELQNLSELLVNHEKELSAKASDRLMSSKAALYRLHQDQPKSFTVSNEWLIAVSKTESVTQEDLLKLQELTKSAPFLNTTKAADWLISVFDAQSVSESQEVGLSALEERIRSLKAHD